jgi:predicted PurR-regulated permease PerM
MDAFRERDTARSMRETDVNTYHGLIAWTIAMVALALVAAWALYLARQVLLLVYVSGLLAIGFGPLVRLIERQKLVTVGSRRLPRWLAILVVYLAILAVLTVVLLTVLPTLISQARGFADYFPVLVERGQRYLIARGLLRERLSVGEMVQQAPIGGDFVGTVLVTVWGFLGGVFGLVTILILTFYLLVESDSLFDTFVRLFPRNRRLQVRAASAEIGAKVSAWLSGQLILAGVIGTTAALGLWLLGVPYFYVLAVIAAVGELIPYIGPLLAAIPGIAVAFTVSGQLAIVATVFYFLQQQFENYVVVPKVMQHQLGLSAVTIIVALLLGASILGVAGAILAVPTAAIVQVLFQELVPKNES